MSRTTEIFERAFMLTGEQADPRDIPFALFTHEEVINNPNGTPATKNYYMNYDLEEGFTNLAVKCQYTYETQPVERRVENIEWFYDDGRRGPTRQLIQITI